jgi:hypothetical protein
MIKIQILHAPHDESNSLLQQMVACLFMWNHFTSTKGLLLTRKRFAFILSFKPTLKQKWLCQERKAAVE